MAVLASSVPPRPAVPQPHAPCPAPCLLGHAEGLYKKARSPTCPLCQFVVKTSSRLTSTVISQARQRVPAVSGGCRGPCPSCCTKGSQCVPKRDKLLKDKSGAALTGIIDEETLAAPRWSALAFPDLRQAPPHVTTFHLPQPARERCSPVYLLWNRGSERLRNSPTRARAGQGKGFGERWAKVLTLKLRIPHPGDSKHLCWRQTTLSIKEGGTRTFTRVSPPWTNRGCVPWESVGPWPSYENSFTHQFIHSRDTSSTPTVCLTLHQLLNRTR